MKAGVSLSLTLSGLGVRYSHRVFRRDNHYPANIIHPSDVILLLLVIIPLTILISALNILISAYTYAALLLKKQPTFGFPGILKLVSRICLGSFACALVAKSALLWQVRPQTWPAMQSLERNPQNKKNLCTQDSYLGTLTKAAILGGVVAHCA